MSTAFNRPKIWGVSGKLTWTLGDYTFSSLSAYRVTQPRNFNDLDVTTANAITQFRSEDDEQLSQELQIVSPAGRDFEWLLGAYYFDETNDVRNEYLFPFVDDMFGLPADPTCCQLRLDGQAKTEASAIFGEANYDFTDKLNVVVGGRYSRERRSGRNDVEFVNFLTPLFDNQTPFEPATFTSFTPKVGLNYQLSDAVFAYASASRGFKSGGFNIGSYQNTPFNPEKIWSYEAGVKTDLLDRRLRLNLAAFYYDYTDLQVQDVEGNNTVVRNAATAVIQGLELETTALLGSAVRARFCCDISGQRVPRQLPRRSEASRCRSRSRVAPGRTSATWKACSCRARRSSSCRWVRSTRSICRTRASSSCAAITLISRASISAPSR